MTRGHPLRLSRPAEVERRATALDDLFKLPDQPAIDPPPVPSQARDVARQVARAVGEVLDGRRPPTQLANWLTGAEQHRLGAWAAAHQREQVLLAAARLAVTTPDEVAAVLRYLTGTRSLAVSVRLSVASGRWRCLAIDFLLPGRSPDGLMPRWGYGRGTS